MSKLLLSPVNLTFQPSIIFEAFDNTMVAKNPKSYWTSKFINEHMHFEMLQLHLGHESTGFGVHTFLQRPSIEQEHFQRLIMSPFQCSITISVAKKLDINIINRMAYLAVRSPSRVHLHIGAMTLKLAKVFGRKYFKVRNRFRSPHVVISKVIYVNDLLY